MQRFQVVIGDAFLVEQNSMIEPDDVSYCYIQAGEYVYFDFRNTSIINVIRFRLWDGDSRIYTYNLDISTNRVDWTSLAAGVEGTSTDLKPNPYPFYNPCSSES